MSLPNATEVGALDYLLQGAPIVQVAKRGVVDTLTLDYSYGAQPFVATFDVIDAPIPWTWWRVMGRIITS